MTLETELSKLSMLHPQRSLTLTLLEHNIHTQKYGVKPKDVSEYLSYKYLAIKQQEKVKPFLDWYIDVYLPKGVK